MQRSLQLLVLTLAAQCVVAAQTLSDAPKRTIFDSPQAKRATASTQPAPARDASSSALDALITSNENLNTIRDSNVRKLGEGCAPEVALRIGEIRGQLGISSTPVRKDAASDAALLALAAGWYKSQNSSPAVTPKNTNDAVASVLPGSANKSPAEEAQVLQNELSRLLASCSGAKR